MVSPMKARRRPRSRSKVTFQKQYLSHTRADIQMTATREPTTSSRPLLAKSLREQAVR